MNHDPQRLEAGSIPETPLVDPGATGAHQAEQPATVSVPLPPRLEGPGASIGPYKLVQMIGDGGMGVVYLADQERPVRRKVALKIIKPGLDTVQVIARFEAERQALVLMDHQNIADQASYTSRG